MKKHRSLYRDSEHARIAGVCAGIANYFGLETWLVRILVVTGFFLLAGPFMIVAYVAAWFILDKQPADYDASVTQGPVDLSGKGWRNSSSDSGSRNSSKVEVKTKVWQAGEPPKQALHDITSRFDAAETRLRKMETYVTSKEFQLNREISRL